MTQLLLITLAEEIKREKSVIMVGGPFNLLTFRKTTFLKENKLILFKKDQSFSRGCEVYK